MARHNIALRSTHSIADEVNRLNRTISRRAYDLFRINGSGGDPLRDWLTAERELVWRPAVELRQTNGRFEVRLALAGVDPTEIDVQISADDLLVKAKKTHEHRADAGSVHLCEFSAGQLFRSVHFAQPVDPASAHAEFRNGMLRIAAAIAQPPGPQEARSRPARGSHMTDKDPVAGRVRKTRP